MRLSVKQAKILLALVISARATSFLFSKLCLVTMSTFSLLALRFSTASILLFILFYKKIIPQLNVVNILSGAAIGALYFSVLAFELMGLKTTNASTASFIENLAIIIVPFMECVLLRKLPAVKILICAVLALIGVGLLTLKGSQLILTAGELYLLIAAFLYAIAIIVTSHLSKKGEPFTIGFFQVFTTGALAWISVGISGNLTLPAHTSQYFMILILAVVCTVFGFTLQPVAQSKLPAETAGAYCSIEPLVAAVISAVCLRETFSPASLCGAVCILLSLFMESGLVKLPAHK